MKSVFGTATEDDLDGLKKQLQDVADSQSEIAHVVKNSMTIVNKTIAQANENTQAINRLNGATTRLSSQLNALQDEIATVQEFVDLELRLTSFVETSLRHIEDALTDCDVAVDQLFADLTAAIHGKLSLTLIAPDYLRQILRTIQNQLPSAFFLKDFEGHELIWFYQHLKTMVLADSEQLHILAVIPLLQTESLYQIYRMSVLPVPLQNEREKASKIKLNSAYFAVSAAKLSYVVMSLDDVVHCQNVENGYCPLQEPYRSLARSPSCESAIFLKNPENIQSFCEIEIINEPPYPVLDHLIDGIWAVSSDQKLYVQKHCNGQISTLTILPGVTTIELPHGCSLEGDSFSLPPYFQESSVFSVNVSDYLSFDHASDVIDLSDIFVSNTTFRISTSHIENFAFRNLSTLSPAPINSVLHEIDKIRRHRIVIENDSTFKIVFLVLLAICFILLCVAGTLYCVFRRKNRNSSDLEKGQNTKVALEFKQEPKKNEPVLIGSLMNIKDESTYL